MVAMIEEARTTASPAAIWVIVVVAVACLVFWLGGMAIASRNPGVRHRRVPGMPGPVLGGTHVSDCGRSVAPNRDFAAIFDAGEAEALAAAGAADAGSPITGQPRPVTVPGQRVPDAAPATSRPSPSQPSAGRPGAPVLPSQRSGDADQAQRTTARP